MKVGCQQCGAAYSVADEKVAGRKLKLRCKKCGEGISVDGTSIGASDSDADSEASFASANDESPISTSGGAEWHVAIGETTQGPYTIEELAEYYADGNIVLDTLIYRTGWPDWVQAGEVAELQGAAAAMRSQSTPNAFPAAVTPPVHAPSFAKAGMGSTMGNDPFDDAAIVGSPRVNAADMFNSSTRHEGTVQFSLDDMRALSAVSAAPSALPAAAPPRPMAQNRPGYASGEGSGLIDMAALVQMQQQPEPAWRPAAGPGVDSSTLDISALDITMAPMSLPVAPANGIDFRTKVFASLAAFGFALVGGLGVLAFTHKGPEPQVIGVQPVAAPQGVAAAAQPPAAAEPVAAAPEREAEAAPTRERAEPSEAAMLARADSSSRSLSKGKSKTKSLIDDSSKPSKHASKAAPAEKPDPIEKVAKAEKEKPAAKGGPIDLDDLLLKGPAKPAGKKSTNIDDLLDDAVSAKKPPKKEAAEPKSELQSTPSRDEMQAAYGKIKGKTSSCKGSGVATAVVNISGSGKVSSVDVSGVEGAAKSCVESAVRSTSFPKFAKDSFQVKFPFKLAGG